MKLKLIQLILCLLITTVSYSQVSYPKILSDSTVVITHQQLKNANKLFLEGQMYKEICKEDSIQISNYKLLINNYEKIDSLRINDINTLQNSLKKSQKRLFFITSTSTIAVAILSIITLFK